MEPGSKLAHYEILSPLGKGGMGEVWRARDTKLGREIAIKTLPEEFAQDADRLARFEREAKLLASLNHPNIAAIYGLEEHNGTRFLVLELVEGPTLADRIKQGAIPVEESLKLALQIVEALESAHEKGVIHRDLKPANIKVTKDGNVKVLDFGLAKAYTASDASVSQSPTMSIAATQQGMILGTAAYMSPEQARGQDVDARTDIWALGCVLFEMLAGKPVFPGNDVTDILAAVVRAEPDWDGLRSDANPRLIELLGRCLEKDPKKRWHHVGDVRVDIERVLDSPTRSTKTESTPVVTGWRQSIPWAIAALLAAVTLVSLLMPQNGGQSAIEAFTLDVTLPDGVYLDVDSGQTTLALKPDGSQLVVVGVRGGVPRLYVRDLDGPDFEAVEIEGTEGAEAPFFSPSGDRVGFIGQSTLKTVSPNSGVPTEIGRTPPSGVPRGGAWLDDETFVYARSQNDPIGLLQRSADQGVLPIAAIALIPELPVPSAWPETLPGGSSLLFSDRSGGPETGNVGLFSFDSRQASTLIEGGTNPKYSETGHVLYGRSGSLYAFEYDVDSGGRGDERLILDGIEMAETGAVHYAVSGNGVLAYVAGGLTPVQDELVWVDREGNIVELIYDPGQTIDRARLSPDESQIAFETEVGPNVDIFVLDLNRNDTTQWTFDSGEDFGPVWHPVNGGLAFSTEIGETDGSQIGPAIGFMSTVNDDVDRLFVRPGAGNWEMATSFSPDGRFLAYKSFTAAYQTDLYVFDTETRTSKPFIVNESFQESTPMISPDGNWIAYVSDREGTDDIWLARFPDGEDAVKVSTNGGIEPIWSRDGSELFYRSGEGIMAVTFSNGPGIPDVPEFLFPDEFERMNEQGPPAYDVSGNREQFVMIRRKNPVRPTTIRVVLNWPEVYGLNEN